MKTVCDLYNDSLVCVCVCVCVWIALGLSFWKRRFAFYTNQFWLHLHFKIKTCFEAVNMQVVSSSTCIMLSVCNINLISDRLIVDDIVMLWGLQLCNVECGVKIMTGRLKSLMSERSFSYFTRLCMYSLLVTVDNLNVKWNPGLPWEKQRLTRRRLFSPANWT